MTYTEVDVTSPATAQHVFIARQPIFDTKRRRVAYELLYRAHRDATQALGVSQSLMCGDTALHSLLSIGLDRLTAGTTAFVNITRDHLVGELYKIFDPQAVVLELLETVDGDPAVVDACERAVAEGYRLALDDYDSRPSLDPLLRFASIVKLDVLGKTAAEIEPAVVRLKARGLTVLAERVETAEMLHACEAMGCVLFQGYVFSRPETLDGRAVNVQHATVFNIMAMLNEPDVTDEALDDAFRSHPALSLSLLRIVNSASFGARSVDSIAYAIRLIGREALSRWMLIMLAATVGSQSPVAHEAVVHALVRGRFCEMVTAHGLPGDPSARFLVGLLSRMDALLGLPIASVLERLPVTDDVRDALLFGTGPHAPVLRLADAYERGVWSMVDAEGSMGPALRAELAALYADAALWAAERLSSAR
jgi:EAL and modified HD-GYP domain-containing signal transduction protein